MHPLTGKTELVGSYPIASMRSKHIGKDFGAGKLPKGLGNFPSGYKNHAWLLPILHV